MNLPLAPSWPPRVSRAPRTLASLGGLAIFLAAEIGLTPSAWATSPPEASSAPVPPPPPTAAPGHFPLWAIAAILAATVVPSVATTLITLALEHTRRARRAPAAATRRCIIGAAVGGAVILAVVLGAARPRAPADSGVAGCTAVISGRQVAAADYPRIRSQFAGSRWPDLQAAGMSYIDLAVKLRTMRYTDGYEAVWFYQRLSVACSRHDREVTAGREQ